MGGMHIYVFVHCPLWQFPCLINRTLFVFLPFLKMATPDDDPATSETFLGRIYRISAPTFERVYVGSTRTTLAARLGRHRSDYRGYQRGRHKYVSSFEVLDHPDAIIDLLEEAEYHDIQQFREREAYWIQRLPSCNRSTPGRSPSASNKISRAVFVPCSTCGRFVRRGLIPDHRRTRHCMIAAFKRTTGSSSTRESNQSCTLPTSQSSCPTSPSSNLQTPL
jgi:hypothetical protein